jgi:hypothetical protein
MSIGPDGLTVLNLESLLADLADFLGFEVNSRFFPGI